MQEQAEEQAHLIILRRFVFVSVGEDFGTGSLIGLSQYRSSFAETGNVGCDRLASFSNCTVVDSECHL